MAGYELDLEDSINGKWEVKLREMIHVSNMSTDHIKKCIKMLEGTNSPWITRFKMVLEYREGVPLSLESKVSIKFK